MRPSSRRHSSFVVQFPFVKLIISSRERSGKAFCIHSYTSCQLASWRAVMWLAPFEQQLPVNLLTSRRRCHASRMQKLVVKRLSHLHPNPNPAFALISIRKPPNPLLLLPQKSLLLLLLFAYPSVCSGQHRWPEILFFNSLAFYAL